MVRAWHNVNFYNNVTIRSFMLKRLKKQVMENQIDKGINYKQYECSMAA